MYGQFVITNLSDIKISTKDNDVVPHPFNDLIQLLIEKSWCKETSSSPDHWTPENPALGQCAVTALLFQDLNGGAILKTDVRGFGSHYWNMMSYPENVTVDYDLTRGQFPDEIKITEAMTVHRSDMLQSERAKQFRTPERYRLLRKRFLQFMSEELHRRTE